MASPKGACFRWAGLEDVLFRTIVSRPETQRCKYQRMGRSMTSWPLFVFGVSADLVFLSGRNRRWIGKTLLENDRDLLRIWKASRCLKSTTRTYNQENFSRRIRISHFQDSTRLSRPVFSCFLAFRKNHGMLQVF